MPAFTWKFEPAAEPDLEDNMHVLLKDGVDCHFAVQDARSYGGFYALNEYTYKGDQLEGSIFRGEFRSLKAAKAKAIELASK